MSDASDEEVGENAGDGAGGVRGSGESDAGDASSQTGEADASDETDASDDPGDSLAPEAADESDDVAALRSRVEEKYDFENFGPAEMAEMSADEWDVAFDADTWITGDELLDRVETELRTRIARREVFAVLEYATVEGVRCLVAYSDSDYAIVYPDGTVEGVGTVVRDVKPSVALCSMDGYEVEEPPEEWALPRPEEVPESGSELGNWMLQLLGATQVLVGLAALVLWPITGTRDNLVLGAVGAGFLLIGIFLFVMVANARLSEKFRVEEYRDRLRSIGLDADERPAFLPVDDEAFESDSTALERGDGGTEPTDRT